MRRRRSSFPLVVAGLALAAFCAPSLMAGQIAGWSVVVANNAFVDHGKGDAASAVSTGAKITAGDRLTTGNGGALVLTRGEDLVTMAENSQIEIVDPQPSATTLIAQPYGHVDYHVTKEQVPHFEVDAPLLATVVKGTTFSVNADNAKSAVTVSEGRVVAKNRRTGASKSVGAGERGEVQSGDRGVEVGASPSNSGAVESQSSDASSNDSDSSSSDSDSSSSSSGNGKDKDKDKSSGNSGNGNGNGNGGGNGKGNGKSKNK